MKAVVDRNPHRLANRPDVFVQQLQEQLDAAKNALVAAAALAKLDPEHKSIANENLHYRATLRSTTTASWRSPAPDEYSQLWKNIRSFVQVRTGPPRVG